MEVREKLRALSNCKKCIKQSDGEIIKDEHTSNKMAHCHAMVHLPIDHQETKHRLKCLN